MVGHLDKLSLSGASIAISYTSVTGFSLLDGRCIGNSLWTSLWSTTISEAWNLYLLFHHFAHSSLLFDFVLWISTDELLILIGQKPAIAQKYSICLIPNLFSYAVLQALICILLNALLLGFYMKYSSICEKTRAAFSKDVFLSIKEFFKFVVPAASYEVIILLSGLLPNPELETSVLSICTRVSNQLGAGKSQAAKVAVCAIMFLAVIEMVLVRTTLFFCRHILGYALSKTKAIANQVAKMGPCLCLCLIMDSLQAVLPAYGKPYSDVGCAGVSLNQSSRCLGMQTMLVLTCTPDVGFMSRKRMDKVSRCSISGLLKTPTHYCVGDGTGSGWQNLGVYVTLGAYYLVGIPVAAVLAFVLILNLKGKGLLIGLATGSSVQAALLGLRTIFTDWQKQAQKQGREIFEADSQPS
ncbi:hypothetical protein Pint_07550 [Pistacia integerrima]|uniref:Uncharacterized protein n=1 Tax=Pistacia integerrima TaxID=434235 RepID=A0ACC0XWD7_9ROSI|nr:hypothetical protein Pint_07550 [Pistacia integerrima]